MRHIMRKRWEILQYVEDSTISGRKAEIETKLKRVREMMERED